MGWHQQAVCRSSIRGVRRWSKSLSLASTGLILLGHVATIGFAQPVADLILFDGKVVTVDPQFRITTAVAVSAGRILRVGSDADVLELRGPQSELIKLNGRMVLPGLIDSHVHAVDASLVEFDHPIPSMETVEDVLSYVRQRAKTLEKGKWILVRQVFITRLREPRYPTRAELDAAAPDHPVAFLTGPDAACNSLALERSGIDRDSPAEGAGKIERDVQTGEPTGILRSARQYLAIDDPARRPTEAERDDRLVKLLSDYNQVGITSALDRSVSTDELTQYRRLAAAGRLNVRFGLSHHIETAGRHDAALEEIRQVAQNPLCQPSDTLRIIGIKTFLDGGMLTGSAYMSRPWGISSIYGIDDDTYRGLRYIPHEQLVELVQTAVENDLQFTAHSVGDGAVQALLDAYAEVSRSTDRVRSTHCCVTHANFMSRQAIDQAAELGVCLDIQPAWLYLDTRTLVAQFGYDRLRFFQPLRSIFAAGTTAGGGSDHMQKIGPMRSINPYHPFWGMWVTLSRQARWYDRTLHPEESLDREQAIRFYTLNNAYLMRMQDRVGSLEAGKLADLIIIDRDLLTCPLDEVPQTRVLATYLGGRRVGGSAMGQDPTTEQNGVTPTEAGR
jgi:predicted amidohydrolase YtcJ